MGLLPYFHITNNSIIAKEHGSEFLFKGIHEDPEEIKSTEGVTIGWLEEAERTSADSLKILMATIRRSGSEIIASWNPENENSAIDIIGRKRLPPDTISAEVSWRDNPYRSAEMESLRRYQQEFDPENYDWIWEGAYRKISFASIFGRKYTVEEFEAPEDARFYYGADWGFAADPTVLTRNFEMDDCLYIDYEAFGYGTELNDIPALFDTIPGARKWPIKADNARPETISHIKSLGFNISAAEKWKGSVEDGIEHLKSYKRIVIHKRCEKIAQEARLYSYKTDKHQLDANQNPVILPEIVDDWNHGWDATRYSHDGLIKRKGKGFFS